MRSAALLLNPRIEADMPTVPLIVVGIDGSPASVRALRWAADEALLRAATLRVIYAWSSPYSDGEIAQLSSEVAYNALGHKTAEQTVDSALRGIADVEVATVERRTVEAQPAQALLEAAQDADLLVVGSRGRGGFSSMLLGSVSHQCALHAPCPVVIVRV